MMTRLKSIQAGLLVAAAACAGGCGILNKKTPTTPVLGERISVLTTEGDVLVDPETSALPMALPDPVVNTEWTQSSGNATKSMGQLALGRTLAQAFTVQAGRGSTLTMRLASQPVVAGGRVFVIDTQGVVRAFDGQTGARVWETATPSDKGNEASIYGGGL